MKKVIVLGAGLVGLPMALDLASDVNFSVSVADIDSSRFSFLEQNNISTIKADLSDRAELMGLIGDYDYVLNAVPGFMGFQTLQRCIEAGKDIIDIAFFPEDVYELNELARENNVRVISDIGVAPGMSNLLTGYAANKLDIVDDVRIYVGGLPKVRTQPWEYKAVFSPTDIIEEYTRPARIVREGKEVVVDPLTEIEHLEFESVGTLEAFNSDGLRSLLVNIKARNMVEKTLRFPGYANKIKFLSDNGFFDTKEIKVGDSFVSPLKLTSAVLFDAWKLHDSDEDITVMRICVSGQKNGLNKTYQFDLHDEFCKETNVHSMARTTGYTATTALRLLESGIFKETGVTLGETLGEKEEIVQFMLAGLKERGIIYIIKEL